MSELQALHDLYESTQGGQWRWYGHGAKWAFAAANDIGSDSGNSSAGVSQGVFNPCYEGWEGVLCSCNISRPDTVSQDYNYYYYGFYDDVVGPRNGNGTGNGTSATATCHVVKLFLNRHSLTGTLPQSLGNLTRLTHLHLDGNYLWGTIPSSLFALHDNNIDTSTAMEGNEVVNKRYSSTAIHEISSSSSSPPLVSMALFQ